MLSWPQYPDSGVTSDWNTTTTVVLPAVVLAGSQLRKREGPQSTSNTAASSGHDCLRTGMAVRMAVPIAAAVLLGLIALLAVHRSGASVMHGLKARPYYPYSRWCSISFAALLQTANLQ